MRARLRGEGGAVWSFALPLKGDHLKQLQTGRLKPADDEAAETLAQFPDHSRRAIEIPDIDEVTEDPIPETEPEDDSDDSDVDETSDEPDEDGERDGAVDDGGPGDTNPDTDDPGDGGEWPQTHAALDELAKKMKVKFPEPAAGKKRLTVPEKIAALEAAGHTPPAA